MVRAWARDEVTPVKIFILHRVQAHPDRNEPAKGRRNAVGVKMYKRKADYGLDLSGEEAEFLGWRGQRKSQGGCADGRDFELE
jgi:hypothetical protein